MFTGHPDTELTKFLNAYKSAGSRLIKKEYPEIKTKLMKKNKAYRYRIYPDEAQQIIISKTIGCARFIYNRIDLKI